MQLANFFNKQNATASIVAAAVSAATLGIGVWDRNIELATSEVQRITSLQERLTSQQRQIDALSTNNSKALSEVKILIADVRKEFLTEGSSKNKLSIALLERRLIALGKRLDGFPIGLNGSANTKALENAIQAAENRITQRMSVQIGGLVDGAVSKAIENQNPALPTGSGQDIPIATVRKIHIATDECVYLPSFGKRFSLQFSEMTDICMEPSQLFAKFNAKRSYHALSWEIIGGGSGSCPTQNTCFFGDKDKDGFRYRVKHEESFEKDGILFRVYNFQQLG